MSEDKEAIMAADDPGWLSPVDGHMHYAIAAKDECAVCILEAERDRLREELAFVGFAVAPEGRTGVIEEHEIVPMAKTLRAERDRLRAGLEVIAIPPVHVPGVSEGCEGCAGVARAALDGTDFSGPVSISLEDVDAVAERDRLRTVVEAVRQWRAASPGHESSVAIQAMHEALNALDAKEGK